MTRALFVAGTWDENGGRKSGLAHKLFEALKEVTPGWTWAYYNGGQFYEMTGDVLPEVRHSHVVLWFANIPNDKPKILREVKARNHRVVLVTSKRNHDEYGFAEMTYRAIAQRANLCIEFSRKPGYKKFKMRVYDPLGNVYADRTYDLEFVARQLAKRIERLLSVRRIPSRSVSPVRDLAPNRPHFFSLVQKMASLVMDWSNVAEDARTRFLGNCSYRDLKKRLWVSQRNINKERIDRHGFVRVEVVPNDYGPLEVVYPGVVKPSVDTPVQLLLFDRFPKVRYMVHVHAYVEQVEGVQYIPWTKDIAPCGDLREYEFILDALMGLDEHADWPLLAPQGVVAVNLRGHGSVVMSETIQGLRSAILVPRNMPENHDHWTAVQHSYAGHIKQKNRAKARAKKGKRP